MTDLNPETHAQMYDSPRAPTLQESRHPLIEEGWQVLGNTVLDDEPDTLLLESEGVKRVLELFEDYAWAQESRLLEWQDFLDNDVKGGDRDGWAQSIREKLEAYGSSVKEPKVWVAYNRDVRGDWLLGLEF